MWHLSHLHKKSGFFVRSWTCEDNSYENMEQGERERKKRHRFQWQKMLQLQQSRFFQMSQPRKTIWGRLLEQFASGFACARRSASAHFCTWSFFANFVSACKTFAKFHEIGRCCNSNLQRFLKLWIKSYTDQNDKWRSGIETWFSCVKLIASKSGCPGVWTNAESYAKYEAIMPDSSQLFNSFYSRQRKHPHRVILVEDRSLFMIQGNGSLVTMFVEKSNPIEKH